MQRRELGECWGRCGSEDLCDYLNCYDNLFQQIGCLSPLLKIPFILILYNVTLGNALVCSTHVHSKLFILITNQHRSQDLSAS